MKKDKYNFLFRLVLVFPSVIILGILWALIGVVSTKSLGNVLKKTGENLLK